MLGSLTIILVCQLLGEIITRLTGLPVPGPVIGMLLLFCGLLLKQRLPTELEGTANSLHRYLALLFVPAGVGVITNLDLLVRSWLPLGGAIVIGTAVTIAVTGQVMQRANGHNQQDEGGAP